MNENKHFFYRYTILACLFCLISFSSLSLIHSILYVQRGFNSDLSSGSVSDPRAERYKLISHVPPPVLAWFPQQQQRDGGQSIGCKISRCTNENASGSIHKNTHMLIDIKSHFCYKYYVFTMEKQWKSLNYLCMIYKYYVVMIAYTPKYHSFTI